MCKMFVNSWRKREVDKFLICCCHCWTSAYNNYPILSLEDKWINHFFGTLDTLGAQWVVINNVILRPCARTYSCGGVRLHVMSPAPNTRNGFARRDNVYVIAMINISYGGRVLIKTLCLLCEDNWKKDVPTEVWKQKRSNVKKQEHLELTGGCNS